MLRYRSRKLLFWHNEVLLQICKPIPLFPHPWNWQCQQPEPSSVSNASIATQFVKPLQSNNTYWVKEPNTAVSGATPVPQVPFLPQHQSTGGEPPNAMPPQFVKSPLVQARIIVLEALSSIAQPVPST